MGAGTIVAAGLGIGTFAGGVYVAGRGMQDNNTTDAITLVGGLTLAAIGGVASYMSAARLAGNGHGVGAAALAVSATAAAIGAFSLARQAGPVSWETTSFEDAAKIELDRYDTNKDNAISGSEARQFGSDPMEMDSVEPLLAGDANHDDRVTKAEIAHAAALYEKRFADGNGHFDGLELWEWATSVESMGVPATSTEFGARMVHDLDFDGNGGLDEGDMKKLEQAAGVGEYSEFEQLPDNVRNVVFAYDTDAVRRLYHQADDVHGDKSGSADAAELAEVYHLADTGNHKGAGDGVISVTEVPTFHDAYISYEGSMGLPEGYVASDDDEWAQGQLR